jgi:hypothetical protein
MTGCPSSVTAGKSFTGNVIVTAYDIYDNVKTNYIGSIYFTSSDNKAVLPYNSTSKYTFVASDNGQHIFGGAGFTLKTVGLQTITMTDGSGHTATSTITVTAT